MNYRLIVLTHGNSETLEHTLESFWEHVTPYPAEYVCIRDGHGKLPPISPDGQTWRGAVLLPQQGFCAATRSAWKAACLPGPDFVFWLEHDFRFLRPVDLSVIAEELDYDEHLAQMSLVRGPANGREAALGGLVNAWTFPHVVCFTHTRAEAQMYLRHDGYFTTNPSLMRTQFMRDNPWPDAAAECEGKFGISLRERGYDFGAWGDGEPWIEHIGRRSGFGY